MPQRGIEPSTSCVTQFNKEHSSGNWRFQGPSWHCGGFPVALSPSFPPSWAILTLIMRPFTRFTAIALTACTLSSPAFAQDEKESGFGFGSEFDDKLDMAQSAKSGENKFGLKDRLKLFSQNIPGLGRGSRTSPYVPSYTSNPPVTMPNANRGATTPIKAPGSATDLPMGEGGGAASDVSPGVGSSSNADGSLPGADVPAAGSQGSRNSLAPDATGISSPNGQGQTQGAGDLNLRGPMGDAMTISQAMNETLINSPRASAVRFNLGVTRAQLIRATELPNPTIFMDSGYRAEFTYRYGATLPIEPPWKLVFRVLAAKKQIKQTDFEIRNALWQLRGDIRRAYTELVVAQETYETLTELYELSARLNDVAEKRFQAGDVPELDVLKARLLNGQNAIERDVGGRRVIQAKQALAILLGRNAQTEVRVPRLSPFKLKAEAVDLLPDFNKDMPQLDVLMAAAKENRLELKVLAQSIKTAQANLKVAYGNVIPNPIIGAGSSAVNGPRIDTRTLNPGDPLPINKFNGYFIQVYQELPIFNFNQGDISLYRATLQQLKSQVVAQENIIQQEVSSSYQKVLAARQKILTYQEKLLNDSNEVARLSRRSYEVGQSDITSTLLTQQANIQIRNQYLDAVNTYQQAFTDLEQSIGTTLQ